MDPPSLNIWVDPFSGGGSIISPNLGHGCPIYDENGNIVGVVVAQLNKRKFEKMVGSMPENVNFGIKASTVRQFLSSSGLPTKWSKRSKSMSTRELAKIAKRQTVMVMCHR
jgi:sensor histidine kinase regulating citrate/malate metabolism